MHASLGDVFAIANKQSDAKLIDISSANEYKSKVFTTAGMQDRLVEGLVLSPFALLGMLFGFLSVNTLYLAALSVIAVLLWCAHCNVVQHDALWHYGRRLHRARSSPCSCSAVCGWGREHAIDRMARLIKWARGYTGQGVEFNLQFGPRQGVCFALGLFQHAQAVGDVTEGG